ncbi:MAG: 3-dehydroquinate synthase [Bacteroidota bacterium]
MQQYITFPSGTVNYLFGSTFSALAGLLNGRRAIIVTDEHVAALHGAALAGYTVVTVPAGEASKTMATIENLAAQLLAAEVTRNTMLIGVGGGVVTDITGFLATVYMRGIAFGFVPTTLLGMADAAIGGKNGVNTGLHKNIIGTITQPEFILYDTALLATLPDAEWSNGFAEIIKYACIFDRELFSELCGHDVAYYQRNNVALDRLIQRCAGWKNKTVVEDEKEKGMRKLLNFGHTAGHAIETLYALPHGQAVGVGMLIACILSEEVQGLNTGVRADLEQLLTRYGLPVKLAINADRVLEVLRMDKKRNTDTVDYILLEETGKAIIKPLSFGVIGNALRVYESSY